MLRVKTGQDSKYFNRVHVRRNVVVKENDFASSTFKDNSVCSSAIRTSTRTDIYCGESLKRSLG